MLNKTQLKAIADQLKIDINNYCVRTYRSDKPRTHLGASLIGKECRRELWYGFRWVKKEEFDGRMYRLFQRGHLEEARFIEYLMGIGCKVQPFDPSWALMFNTSTGDFTTVQIDSIGYEQCQIEGYIDVSTDSDKIKVANAQNIEYPVQWKVGAVQGHFGGSMDGRGYLPDGYPITEEILFEFKTANEKSSKDLDAKGMQMSKEQHYHQTCTYGYLEGFNYVCYVSTNKNDDEIYLEILPLNKKTGEMDVLKAESIIFSQEPPPKLYENPTYYKCKTCAYTNICHGNNTIDIYRNCRSCKNARPIENKQWKCDKYNCIIPKEEIHKTFECWESII